MIASHIPDDNAEPKTARADTSTDWLAPETRVVSAQSISGYSRVVGSLKLLLPICGACILLIIMVLPSINGSNVEPKKLSAVDAAMVSPVYSSRDQENRPYEVTADTARQQPDAGGKTDLTNPKAVIDLGNGKKLDAEGKGAVYNQNDGTLNVQQGVVLRHSDGTTFTTQEAHIDMNSKNAEGTKPVLLEGNFGEVRGEGFKTTEGGKTIIFTGQSSAKLKLGGGANTNPAPTTAQPSAPTSAAPANAGLPSPPENVQNAPAVQSMPSPQPIFIPEEKTVSPPVVITPPVTKKIIPIKHPKSHLKKNRSKKSHSSLSKKRTLKK